MFVLLLPMKASSYRVCNLAWVIPNIGGVYYKKKKIAGKGYIYCCRLFEVMIQCKILLVSPVLFHTLKEKQNVHTVSLVQCWSMLTSFHLIQRPWSYETLLASPTLPHTLKENQNMHVMSPLQCRSMLTTFLLIQWLWSSKIMLASTMLLHMLEGNIEYVFYVSSAVLEYVTS